MPKPESAEQLNKGASKTGSLFALQDSVAFTNQPTNLAIEKILDQLDQVIRSAENVAICHEWGSGANSCLRVMQEDRKLLVDMIKELINESQNDSRSTTS